MDSQDSAQVQKTAPKRNSKLDDEEMMDVLGHRQRRSNDAVSIAKPGNRRTGYKHPSSGIMPMNTLTMSRTLPDQVYSVRSSAPKGRQHMLSVDVTRGYNVEPVLKGEIGDSFEAPRSAKRQKLIHTVSRSPESSDSTIDDLHPDQVVFGKPHDRSELPRTQQPGGKSSAQQSMEIMGEYRSVEGMMNSNPRNGKRNKGISPPKPSSPLMESLSRNNSVEVVGEGEHAVMPSAPSVASKYMGTLQKQPAMFRTNDVRDRSRKPGARETQSHYFQPKLPVQTTEANQSLRTSFVATNGRQRGTDYLSSDELDGPVTLGEHADTASLSPRKSQQPHGSKSPTLDVRTAESSPPDFPMERSNIKPTVFQISSPSKSRLGRQQTFDDDLLDEEKPLWAVSVAAINLPGQKEMDKRSDMAMVFDEKQGFYYIKASGKAYRGSNGSTLGLYPKSLQKCSREKGGGKIRFESSKRGTEDRVLDLELKTEKDAATLIIKIQESSTNVKVSEVDSAKMQRFFEVRRNQSRPAPHSTEGLKDMPEDVQMAARNQQRRETKDQQMREESNAKRRRTGISNQLTDNSFSDELLARFSSGHIFARPRTNLSSPPTAKASENASSRSSMFDKVRPAHNDHLRRSTRTSGGISRFLEQDTEECQQPKVEKHSVKYGLGNKWSKPLSYPRTGKKKATVEWEDLERLDEGEFLNDNLVSFYMRYLEEEFTNKDPVLAKTVYFFNSFFYDRLTTNHKGQKSVNYEGVQRWTRGVNLFAYDFVIVPINELTHWYVAIICNLPALNRSMDTSDPSSPLVEAQIVKSDQPPQDSVVNERASEPVEKEARQSFAELSLDCKHHKHQSSEDSLLGKLNSGTQEREADRNEDDDEMLDAPILAGEASPSRALKEKEAGADPIVDTDKVSKPTTPSKKQKRKSMVPSITKFDPSGPSIITFDSFGHPHSVVIRTLKQYLYEEGKAKRNLELDVSHIKGITAKNIPQQSNFSDCGLFMLGYLEKFLEDRPRDFIAKIIKREYNDQKDWPKMVPSKMRNSLRKQLQKLHEEDQDERRAVAIKTGKLVPESRSKNLDTSTTKAMLNGGEEAVSKKLSEAPAEESPILQRVVPSDSQPIHIQSGSDVFDATAPGGTQIDSASRPEQSHDAAFKVNDSLANGAHSLIDSQTFPEVASKEEQPDIPSSGPPNPQTQGHNIPGSFPTLPNEIEDSQPSQQLRVEELQPPSLPARPKSKSKSPDETLIDPALSPRPEFRSKMEPTARNQNQAAAQALPQANESPQHEDMTTTATSVSSAAPPNPPKRRGKKGVAQKVVSSPAAARGRPKKMTREEAIVLDD